MFTYILLDCLSKMNAERTVSGVYHLLRGKKSSQTFQDAKVYGIEGYYGVYPGLQRETLDYALHELYKEGKTVWHDHGRMSVTAYGEGSIEETRIPLYFSGLEYSEAVEEFRNRLLLWIQIISNAVYRHTGYLPIVDKGPVQNWARKFYSERKAVLDEDAPILYKELRTLLTPFSDMEKEMFVRRLTGGDRTGWTYSQLAEENGEPVWDIPLYLTNMYYYMFSEVSSDSSCYLYKLTEDLMKKEAFTSSSGKSIELYNKFGSIEKVAKIRQLQPSTIEDHLVEAVLVDPARNTDAFISREGARDIAAAVRKTNTKRLKVIREQLNGDYSYFQIRIVLAKLQKGQG
ncbi:hypothetical protein AAV35_006015 [Salimicrobium jeotgali]|uniref:Helicase Helix-turn-helix domain-containing protein n=3 Tax=Salimicrobium TaxID=351195 RepID=A0AAC8PRN9_9BACI|nr:hypothetical protein AAV35_006015 [Salimicrobium jeotgali]PBB05486.1 hypothetical protein CKW00_08830 [Salimicrobium humidisoli]